MGNQTGRAKGFSLVETAIIILFISLAMVPVIATMGGVNDPNSGASSTVNVSAVSGFRSKTMVAANSIMERALAGDTTVSFDASTIFTQPGDVQTTPRRLFYGSTPREYSQPIEYDWVVRDLGYRVDGGGDLIDWAGNSVNWTNAVELQPVGNQVIHAVLRVYENAGDANPMMSLPTYFFRSNCGQVDCAGVDVQKTGVIIVGDISGSMAWVGRTYPSPGTVSRVSSPWLRNRYPIFGNAVPASIRIDDPFDDEKLDVTWVLPFANEDPDTPYSDTYIRPGGDAFITFANNCDDLSTPANRALIDPYLVNNTTSNAGRRTALERLCGTGAWRTPAMYSELMGRYMSRMEAFRNSMLSLLVKLEDNQFLVQNMKMGFVTFSGGVQTRVNLEDAAQPSVSSPVPSAVTDNKFINMRLNMLMLNRPGAGQILQGGSTRMHDGARRAADMLYADSDVKRRMIILVTDGDPNPGNQGNPLLLNLASSIGNGCFPTIPANAGCADPENTTTLFTVAVIGVSAGGQTMLTDAAQRTPSGQFFNAENVEDMGPIFDQITWQIQRTVLTNMVNRYHLDPVPG